MADQESYAAELRSILIADPFRWHLLGVVRALGLPDLWIGAGFVRNAVWDHLHGRKPSPPLGDVDVLWFDRSRADPDEDLKLEAALVAWEPTVVWSVKNQARMHSRNGDAPYPSTIDAMKHWPETATAVAARRNNYDECEIAAPFGFNDLFRLRLMPTPRFTGEKHAIFDERVRTKGWLKTWPLLLRSA